MKATCIVANTKLAGHVADSTIPLSVELMIDFNAVAIYSGYQFVAGKAP